MDLREKEHVLVNRVRPPLPVHLSVEPVVCRNERLEGRRITKPGGSFGEDQRCATLGT